MWKKLFTNDKDVETTVPKAKPSSKKSVSNRQLLLEEVRKDGRKTNKFYAGKVGITEAYTSILINDMKKSGTIRVTGSAYKGTRRIEAVASRVNSRKRRTTTRAPAKRRQRMKNGEPIKRVYAFIADNEDKPLSYEAIKRATGVSTGSVYRVIARLEKEKKIVASDFGADGRKFWLYDSIEKGPKPKASETERTDTTTPRNGNQAVMKLLDNLVMEYVQDTRDTNVLEFLNWLERLEKLD